MMIYRISIDRYKSNAPFCQIVTNLMPTLVIRFYFYRNIDLLTSGWSFFHIFFFGSNIWWIGEEFEFVRLCHYLSIKYDRQLCQTFANVDEHKRKFIKPFHRIHFLCSCVFLFSFIKQTANTIKVSSNWFSIVENILIYV